MGGGVWADWLPSHGQVLTWGLRATDAWYPETSHSLRSLWADHFFHPSCQGLSLADWSKKRPCFCQLFSALIFQQWHSDFWWVCYGLSRGTLNNVRTGRSSRAGQPVQCVPQGTVASRPPALITCHLQEPRMTRELVKCDLTLLANYWARNPPAT